uniref:non-specific serine/threonine protein kinase n=1 Tax=Quercus lobata TaxID=97700 RepID=A0A7N2L6N8_QUELO
MKPKLDLVSMLLVNVNGRSPVLDIKKRKAKEGFAGVRPAKNTLMLKWFYCILVTYINADGGIELIRNKATKSSAGSVGRALYKERVLLWNNSTGRQTVTDFTTHFSFIIKPLNNPSVDGLAFFVAPFNSTIPTNNTVGENLGLFSGETTVTDSQNQTLAVEFDTYQNPWDPSNNHVGIDVNSIDLNISVTWPNSIKNGVGFFVATGAQYETHTILHWSFNSTLEETKDGSKQNKLGLGIGVAVSSIPVGCALGLIWFIYWRKRADGNTEDLGDDDSMDDEFVKGTGPRRFAYRELLNATNNFLEGGKLGEGGFRGIYKGLLSESNVEVAVKRVSKGSRQRQNEYMSKVKTISRLRHKNLVQLIGWFHEQHKLLHKLLIVYEYMPYESLDSHLFGAKTILTWSVRVIKSSNIILDSNFNAKLGDFGLARLVDHGLSSQTTVLAGTMGYLAP